MDDTKDSGGRNGDRMSPREHPRYRDDKDLLTSEHYFISVRTFAEAS
jgi:hypothetical protein